MALDHGHGTDRDPIEYHVSKVLEHLGYAGRELPDAVRDGVSGTPKRVSKFMRWWCQPEAFDFTTFASEGMDEMVVQTGIPFFSLCEHHMLPFFGVASVSYIPNGRIVGLSKLARCVQFYARGLQNQERITRSVAQRLSAELNTSSVGVVLRARHMCMEMRGVRSHDTETVTSCLMGSFREDPRCRSEFLDLARTK